MLYVYITCLIFIVAMYLWLRLTDVKRSLSQHALMLLLIITTLGFIAFTLSTNLEEALLANKITYIGACYLPVVYVFNVLEVCHYKLKKSVATILILIQTAIYGCVLTTGYSDIFYKSVAYTSEGYSRLIKVYAPLHSSYMIAMGIYLVVAIATPFLALYHKKQVNIKELASMIICSTIVVIFLAISKLAHFDMDLMPVFFCFLIVGTLYPIYQSNLFTVYENTEMVEEQLSNVGFITIKKNFEYMGCDEFAINVFPTLKNNLLGKPIDTSDRKVALIVNWIREFSDSDNADSNEHNHEKKTFMINNRYYDCVLHTMLNFRKKLIGYTVEIRDTTEHHNAIELKNRYNEELKSEVDRNVKRISDIQQKTILGMAQIVESRDLSTGGHVKRTSAVVRIFSKALLKADNTLDEHFLNLVIRSAPMHDLGKIGVEDKILRKNGKYTDDEYNQMKRHSEIGAKLVDEILTGVEEDDFVQVAKNVAHYHHEKVNGKGYPEGLSGENIPIEARIMALADVFDALVSKRCYKDAFSFDEAFDIIKKDSGSHFDSYLADIFLSCRSEIEEYYNKN